jgi:hypothetical protein
MPHERKGLRRGRESKWSHNRRLRKGDGQEEGKWAKKPEGRRKTNEWQK